MKALTLWPEWAYCITHLDKRVENRSWSPSLAIGERFAIHAGATRGNVGRACRYGLIGYDPRIRSMVDSIAPLWAISGDPSRCPTRAIVCTAMLVGVDEAMRTPWDIENETHWRLDDVRPLAEPVPVQRGLLGLWNCSHLADMIASLEVQA